MNSRSFATQSNTATGVYWRPRWRYAQGGPAGRSWGLFPLGFVGSATHQLAVCKTLLRNGQHPIRMRQSATDSHHRSQHPHAVVSVCDGGGVCGSIAVEQLNMRVGGDGDGGGGWAAEAEAQAAHRWKARDKGSRGCVVPVVRLSDGTLELVRSIDSPQPLLRVRRLRATLMRPSLHRAAAFRLLAGYTATCTRCSGRYTATCCSACDTPSHSPRKLRLFPIVRASRGSVLHGSPSFNLSLLGLC